MKRINFVIGILSALVVSGSLWACKTLTPTEEKTPPSDTVVSDAKDDLSLFLESGQTEKVMDLFKTKVDANSKNARGETPLHLVVKRGEAELAGFLIAAGARIDEKDAEGRTPLEIACLNRDSKTAAILSTAGANIFLTGASGRTPVDYALESIGLLGAIITKANVDNQDAHGKTILHLAVQKGSLNLVEAILQIGAKPSLRDHDGKTPLDAAYAEPSMATQAAIAERLILAGSQSDNRQFNYFATAVRSSNFNIRFEDNFAPLHFAARDNQTGYMEFMINRNADVNAKNSSGAPPLHEAVREGNLEAVKVLLRAKADINARDANGNSAMHLVMPLESRFSITKYLLDNGADPNIKDVHGEAPLHIVISLDLGLDMLEALLTNSRNKADPNLRNTNGKTPLHTAVERERSSYIPSLLINQADIFATDNHGLSPFIAALGKGLGILDSLITKQTVLLSDNMGNSLLHAAVSAKADTRTVSMILDAGGSVKARNKNGDTPLHLAVIYDLREVGTLLIERGSDIFSTNSAGQSPLYLAAHEASDLREWIINATTLKTLDGLGNAILHYAARWKLDSLIDSLVQRGSLVDQPNATGETALFEAVKINSPSTIEALLKAGASPTIRDAMGNTALHAAVRWNADQAATALIAGNIDVNARNLTGKTALHDAVRLGMINLESRLIAAGADLEARDLTGVTCLMESVSAGLATTVERLLAKGAYAEARNYRGDTPLHIAVAAGRRDIASLLLAQNVSIHSKNAVGQTPFREAMVSSVVMANTLLTSDRLNQSDDQGKAPLHIAVELGSSPEVVRSIITLGGRVNDLDCNGRTPLRIAIEAGKLDLVRVLAEASSDLFAVAFDGESPATMALAAGAATIKALFTDDTIKQQDPIGNSALHYAARSDPTVIKQLLELGAQKTTKNVAGESAYDLAIRWKKDENAKLLK